MKIKHLIASISVAITMSTALIMVPATSWAQSANNVNATMDKASMNSATSLNVSFNTGISNPAPSANANALPLSLSLQVQENGLGFTIQKYLLLGCLGFLMGLAIFLFL
jgi:hypothetical protein